jgi:GNAT superfamily N-acetyltransferase
LIEYFPKKEVKISSFNMNYKIRKGNQEDIPAMLRLIRELAEFEKAPDEVENTEERILEDGFGQNPVFGFYVAEFEDEIIGMAVYYYRYSTWKGRRLFLEDLIITEPHRGKGVGKALFEVSLKHAEENNCNGMVWQVLDWNEPAINFYKKYGAAIDSGWLNASLSLPQIKDLNQKISNHPL